MKSPKGLGDSRLQAVGFLPEIQGIRAIAALMVATYHIWLNQVSGGVDVLFVVSGFLTTASLLGRTGSTGKIDIPGFWNDSIKRLLPMAMLVMFVTVCLSPFILPQTIWVETIKQATASSVYLGNWHLGLSAIDYLNQIFWKTPVQHYWALSVQGQFLVIWPLILAVSLYVSRRYQYSLASVFSVAVLLTLISSFLYALSAIAASKEFAYFDTFARLWEFSIGAVVAICIPFLKRWQRGPRVVGWIGVLGIVTAGFLLDPAWPFPGYAALMPTLCAAIVLGSALSGSNAPALLTKGPLVRLGSYAYGLYLWHWPVFVFIRFEKGGGDLNVQEGLFVIALALLLSVASTRALKSPVRRFRIGESRWWHAFALAVVLGTPTVVSLAGWSGYTLHLLNTGIRNFKVGDPHHPGALAVAEGDGFSMNHDVIPRAIDIGKDEPEPLKDGCHQNEFGEELTECTYGADDARYTVFIVGASHSLDWVPAFIQLADELDLRVISYTKSACLFKAIVDGGSEHWYESCYDWNEQLMARILEVRPDLVFTAATRGQGAAEHQPRGTPHTEEEHIPPGYIESWRILDEAGIKVLALRDTPWMPFDGAECVELYGGRSDECRAPRADALSASDPTRRLEGHFENVHFADLSHLFCDSDFCYSVAGNILIWRDDNHITASYIKSAANSLKPHILETLGADPAERLTEAGDYRRGESTGNAWQ